MRHADRFLSQQLVRFAYSGVDRRAPRCAKLVAWLQSLCPALREEDLLFLPQGLSGYEISEQSSSVNILTG